MPRHERVSFLGYAEHGTPPFWACDTSLRVRNWAPGPSPLAFRQCLSHADHEENGSTTQSLGHACALHTRELNEASQRECLGVRVWVPPPHDREQVVHAFHSCGLQSHDGRWHSFGSVWRTISGTGHALPPCSGWARLRVLREMPEPHVTSQADHELHAPTTQSMGHGMSVLPVARRHDMVSCVCWHAAPPNLGKSGAGDERLRVW